MNGALAIAHRAGNSLHGLRAAHALGAELIEADVHSYRGRLEVRHARTMGPLPWLWDGRELRSATAPRLGLDALLDAAHHGVTFMLDLKGRGVSAGVAVAAELHARAPDRPIVVCSRNWPALDPFASIPWVRTVRSARRAGEFRRLLAGLAGDPEPVRGYGVSVHRPLLDDAVAARLHRHVEVVMTWPVNDSATLAQVLRYRGSGTVGVISDSADVLRRVLAPDGGDRRGVAGSG